LHIEKPPRPSPERLPFNWRHANIGVCELHHDRLSALYGEYINIELIDPRRPHSGHFLGDVYEILDAHYSAIGRNPSETLS